MIRPGFCIIELAITVQVFGRFASEDPTGIREGDWNLHTYVRNSPLLFKDPLGLCPSDTQSCPSFPPSPWPAGRKDPPKCEDPPPPPSPPLAPPSPPIMLSWTAARGGRSSDMLARCLTACDQGIAAIEQFCRSLPPDPRIRALCWAARWSKPACRGFCYAIWG